MLIACCGLAVLASGERTHSASQLTPERSRFPVRPALFRRPQASDVQPHERERIWHSLGRLPGGSRAASLVAHRMDQKNAPNIDRPKRVLILISDTGGGHRAVRGGGAEKTLYKHPSVCRLNIPDNLALMRWR